MTQLIQGFIKIIIFILVLAGGALIYKNQLNTQKALTPISSSKALALKKYLLKYEDPQRVEIFGLSDKFAVEIKEIKKLKIAQSPASDFYVTIQLFSDENDKNAPLIAQIRFIDLKSGNLRKEESINLE
ncbi:MAG: hypothetical protein H7256_13990 [Bdellovibrio sp.]|nr:hypothetical protein [Bdellovibrio sp.]